MRACPYSQLSQFRSYVVTKCPLDVTSVSPQQKFSTVLIFAELTDSTTAARLRPFIRSTRVSRYQKKHSLIHTLSLWLLYNIFKITGSFDRITSSYLPRVFGRLVRRKSKEACRRRHSAILDDCSAHASTHFRACAATRRVSPCSASPTESSTSTSGGRRAARSPTSRTRMSWRNWSRG